MALVRASSHVHYDDDGARASGFIKVSILLLNLTQERQRNTRRLHPDEFSISRLGLAA